MSLLRRIEQEKRAQQAGQNDLSASPDQVSSSVQQRRQKFAPFTDASKPYEYKQLRQSIEAEILDDLASSLMTQFPPAAEVEIRRSLESIIEDGQLVLNPATAAQLYQDILANVIGLSVLDPLLADASITEIIVNSSTDIGVVQNGNLSHSSATFDDDQHLIRILQRIALLLNRQHFDEAHPTLEGTLPDGTQVKAERPRSGQYGPVLLLRKHFEV